MDKTKKPAKLKGTPRKVFDFIVAFKRKSQGRSPSYREILAGTSLKSTNSIHYNIVKLVEAGVIEYDDTGASTRSLKITGAEWVFDEEWNGE